MAELPASTNISASAKQLASLDLLIAKKQLLGDSVPDYTDDITANLGNVAANATIAAVTAAAMGATPAAGIAAGVGVVAAAAAITTQMIVEHPYRAEDQQAFRAVLNETARQMPVERLIELRNLLLEKK